MKLMVLMLLKFFKKLKRKTIHEPVESTRNRKIKIKIKKTLSITLIYIYKDPI